MESSMWIYELWETESRNLMASFDSEAAALDAVASFVREHGPAAVATVALARLDDEDEDCEMTRIAAGDELLARIGQTA